jgi:hypothetical protein
MRSLIAKNKKIKPVTGLFAQLCNRECPICISMACRTIEEKVEEK